MPVDTSLGGAWRDIRALERSQPRLRRYRGELLLVSFAVNVFALGLPIFILHVVDRVLPETSLAALHVLAAGLFGVLVLDALMRAIRSTITAYHGARLEHLMRCAAVDRLLGTPMDAYQGESPIAHLDSVIAIDAVKHLYSSEIGSIVIDFPFALIFLVLIAYLGGILVVVPIALLVVFGTLAALVGPKLRRAVVHRADMDSRRHGYVMEVLRGIHTIKAQALQPMILRRFERLQERSAHAVQDVAIQGCLADGLGSLTWQLTMGAVIGTGAILVVDGSLSPGELAACMVLSGLAMRPLQSAIGAGADLQSARVACRRALDVMSLSQETEDDLPDMPAIRGAIELRDVAFAYGDGTEPVIDRLNLTIEAGECVGIEGDIASGRSTLLGLMMGLHRPLGGRVLIDGIDISGRSLRSWRSQVALIEAGADTFRGTLIENMTSFRTGERVARALTLALALGVDEVVRRLPEGYETRVGDGAGDLIPAGLRQLIGIIRALVDRPRIILFDEGDAALDARSLRLLRTLLERLKGRTTLVLVSGRPDLLEIADRRLIMEAGRLHPKPATEPLPVSQPEVATAAASGLGATRPAGRRRRGRAPSAPARAVAAPARATAPGDSAGPEPRTPPSVRRVHAALPPGSDRHSGPTIRMGRRLSASALERPTVTRAAGRVRPAERTAPRAGPEVRLGPIISTAAGTRSRRRPASRREEPAPVPHPSMPGASTPVEAALTPAGGIRTNHIQAAPSRGTHAERTHRRRRTGKARHHASLASGPPASLPTRAGIRITLPGP